jgi:hypothetical protein
VRESRTDPVGGDMTVIDRAYTRALADSVDTEQQNG